MRKPIRLTESDLNRIVKNSVRRAIKEGAIDEGFKDTLRDGALGVGLGAAAAAGVLGTDNHVSRFVKDAPPIRQEYDIRDTSDDDMNRMAYFDDFRKNESRNNNYKNELRNMKKLIRLTESDLHRIVKESVNRILREEIDEYLDRNNTANRQAWEEMSDAASGLADGKTWKSRLKGYFDPKWKERKNRQADLFAKRASDMRDAKAKELAAKPEQEGFFRNYLMGQDSENFDTFYNHPGQIKNFGYGFQGGRYSRED